MKNIILLILMTISSLFTFGQPLQDINFNDLNSKSADFKGGQTELKKLFAMNYKYPEDSKYGTMIGIIIINQEKNEIETLTLNSPGKSYDKEFNRVVQLSKDDWEKDDSSKILYSVITLDFSFSGANYFVDYDKQPSFICGNIYLRHMSDLKLKTDEDLVKKLNDSYSKEDYKKVDKITSELIKRNPFYPQFYTMRIKALNALGKDSSKELWVLKEFLHQKE